MAVVNLEGRVRKDHPRRTIKSVADEALERLSGDCGSQTNGTLGTVDSVGPETLGGVHLSGARLRRHDV